MNLTPNRISAVGRLVLCVLGLILIILASIFGGIVK